MLDFRARRRRVRPQVGAPERAARVGAFPKKGSSRGNPFLTRHRAAQCSVRDNDRITYDAWCLKFIVLGDRYLDVRCLDMANRTADSVTVDPPPPREGALRCDGRRGRCHIAIPRGWAVSRVVACTHEPRWATGFEAAYLEATRDGKASDQTEAFRQGVLRGGGVIDRPVKFRHLPLCFMRADDFLEWPVDPTARGSYRG